MDPFKIASIIYQPQPIIVKEVRAFLGLTRYYKRFVKSYGLIAQPLTALLKKNVLCQSEEAKKARDALKKAMVSAPVLTLPNFDDVFLMETYACSRGIGEALSQKKNPIALFSKALSPKQQGLSVYENDMLAILVAIKTIVLNSFFYTKKLGPLHK